MVTTSSFIAVLKMALRIDLLQYSMVRAEAPLAFMAVTHSRTCSGMMSGIFIGPKNGIRCLWIWPA
jgi:hypothetical protein